MYRLGSLDYAIIVITFALLCGCERSAPTKQDLPDSAAETGKAGQHRFLIHPASEVIAERDCTSIITNNPSPGRVFDALESWGLTEYVSPRDAVDLSNAIFRDGIHGCRKIDYEVDDILGAWQTLFDWQVFCGWRIEGRVRRVNAVVIGQTTARVSRTTSTTSSTLGSPVTTWSVRLQAGWSAPDQTGEPGAGPSAGVEGGSQDTSTTPSGSGSVAIFQTVYLLESDLYFEGMLEGRGWFGHFPYQPIVVRLGKITWIDDDQNVP